MEKIIAGTVTFGNKIELTDPCYDRGVWCRINDVEIVPGDYTCIAYVKDTASFGRRIAKIGIYLDGKIRKGFKKIDGEVGVDAGMAGFFENKKDFSHDEWAIFCSMCKDYPTIIVDNGKLFNGFCTSSGYGDGGYYAYGVKNDNGKYVAIEIRFL